MILVHTVFGIALTLCDIHSVRSSYV